MSLSACYAEQLTKAAAGAGRGAGQGSGSLTEPKVDSIGEGEGPKEGVGASVAPHGSAAPVLEPAEDALDAVPLLVDGGIVRDGMFAAAG